MSVSYVGADVIVGDFNDIHEASALPLSAETFRGEASESGRCSIIGEPVDMPLVEIRGILVCFNLVIFG